jgi:hypothetical protein
VLRAQVLIQVSLEFFFIAKSREALYECFWSEVHCYSFPKAFLIIKQVVSSREVLGSFGVGLGCIHGDQISLWYESYA